MRHVTVDEWSTRDGALHRRDPRAKLLALLALLVAVALCSRPGSFVALALLLVAGLSVSRAPVGGFLMRVGALLVFPLTFSTLVAVSGDSGRASLLLVRSGLSISAILLTVSTTPVAGLLAALRSFGAPALLVEIVQFVYRYLFVLGEEAWHIRTAAAVRGGRRNLTAAAAMVGVLFGRAYARAEGIHRAIAARSYSGMMYAPVPAAFRASDGVFFTAVAALAVGCVVSERMF